MPLISVLSDISGILYHIFYDISAYVMVVPAQRAGASWGGARRQVLQRLQPRYHDRRHAQAGGVCSTEQ